MLRQSLANSKSNRVEFLVSHNQLIYLFSCFRPRSTNDLNNILPKYVKNFSLFVSDDVLLYSLVRNFKIID